MNMSYCRFENTYKDLLDCYRNIDDADLSEDEKYYRDKLIQLAQKIYSENTDDNGDNE